MRYMLQNRKKTPISDGNPGLISALSYEEGVIMNSTIIAAALLSLCFAMPAFAIELGQQPQGTGPNFEERKAEILKRIDGRLTSLQQMKACIQTAHNSDDAKACREKFGLKEGRGPDFEQRKAEISKNIDKRLVRLQQMKTCIQAAQTRYDARSCREKFGIQNGPEKRQR